VLIEKLRAAGVKVDAPTVEPNPIHLLPAKNCYEPDMRVAELHGLSYAEDAKLIAKGQLQHRGRHQPPAVRRDAGCRLHAVRPYRGKEKPDAVAAFRPASAFSCDRFSTGDTSDRD
jgi:hypothetical protein